MQVKNGDLFQNIPQDSDIVVIPHVCNDIGGWGRGFVLAVEKHFPEAKLSYKSLIGTEFLKLGHTDFAVGLEVVVPQLEIEKQVIIANMIAQHDVVMKVIDGQKTPPIRYDALEKCMQEVAMFCKNHISAGKNLQILCPMFGAGLAGGDWQKISKMIETIWDKIPVTVFVYE